MAAARAGVRNEGGLHPLGPPHDRRLHVPLNECLVAVRLGVVGEGPGWMQASRGAGEVRAANRLIPRREDLSLDSSDWIP